MGGLDWRGEKAARENLGYQGGQESKGGRVQRVHLTQIWQNRGNLDPWALKETMVRKMLYCNWCKSIYME